HPGREQQCLPPRRARLLGRLGACRRLARGARVQARPPAPTLPAASPPHLARGQGARDRPARPHLAPPPRPRNERAPAGRMGPLRLRVRAGPDERIRCGRGRRLARRGRGGIARAAGAAQWRGERLEHADPGRRMAAGARHRPARRRTRRHDARLRRMAAQGAQPRPLRARGMTIPVPTRASGVLLHPTSLPGPLGAGDFGDAAYRFVDWLAEAGMGLWQVLPLAPAGEGDSPYMSPSAFAIDPALIDLAALRDQRLLAPDALDRERLPAEFAQAGRRAAFAANREFRMARLRDAADRWAELRQPRGFESFCVAEAHWPDDSARFMAISQAWPGRPWQAWPAELRNREAAALAKVDASCEDDIRFWKFCQWIAWRQWSALRAHANR